MGKQPTSIWTITDGKIGDEVQCAGVAKALGGAVTKIAAPSRALTEIFAPWGPIDPRDGKSIISPPFPDVLIASGRRAIPYARAVKAKSSGKTFVVLLKDPRIKAGFADLIWAPTHDNRKGENVFSTLTSPHGLASAQAEKQNEIFENISELPKPILGVVLGGPSGGAEYDTASADLLAKNIDTAMCEFGSIAITPSRRTPQEFTERVQAQLQDHHIFCWDGAGANPYVSILFGSDSLIVSGDSHNMVSEAVSTGVGVYVYRPKNIARKMAQFLDDLVQINRVRNFAESAAPFSAAPIDATEAIASEIAKKLRNSSEAVDASAAR